VLNDEIICPSDLGMVADMFLLLLESMIYSLQAKTGFLLILIISFLGAM
jgi:hypothetical protein